MVGKNRFEMASRAPVESSDESETRMLKMVDADVKSKNI